MGSLRGKANIDRSNSAAPYCVTYARVVNAEDIAGLTSYTCGALSEYIRVLSTPTGGGGSPASTVGNSIATTTLSSGSSFVNTPFSGKNTNGSSGGLSGGAIGGIVAGAIIAIFLAIFLVLYIRGSWCRRRGAHTTGSSSIAMDRFRAERE